MSHEEMEYEAQQEMDEMNDATGVSTAESEPVVDESSPADPNEQQIAQASHKFVSGANWFYWIAGLSLINTALIWSGSDKTFIIGLGVTMTADFLAHESGKQMALIIAANFDVIVIGLYVLFGVFARKGQQWAFIVGMIFYALDGVIFLLAGDWLSVGFHVFALFGIASGWKALKQLKAFSVQQQTVTHMPMEDIDHD